LRDVGFFCRAGEGGGVGDGAEVAELVEFHFRWSVASDQWPGGSDW